MTRCSCALLLLLLSQGWARADSAIVVRADGASCPSGAAVASVLAELFPERIVRGIEVTISEDSATESLVSISDDGRRYRVSVAGHARDFDDPARRCRYRARTAAVFVNSILAPPTVAATPAPARATPVPLKIDLQAAGVFDAAPRTPPDESVVAGGGEVRLYVGVSRIGGTLGIGAFAGSTLNFGVVQASLTRLPIDLSVRGAWRLGRLEFAAELGPTISLLLVEGVGVATPSLKASADFGLRVGIQLAVWVSERIAPFLAIQTIISPRPATLSVDPNGPVGSTPYAWLGLAIGLRLRLH